jgi:hypothetical protein
MELPVRSQGCIGVSRLIGKSGKFLARLISGDPWGTSGTISGKEKAQIGAVDLRKMKRLGGGANF